MITYTAQLKKLQVFAEGVAPAGDLSEEVDEVQSCSVRHPGEEEGYDADSESNPETMKQQEEADLSGWTERSCAGLNL
ncbi:hypothetical protein AMECASPLE_032902 [Ameca splendens]|uniref:Uncharacterized protein n=1 Tax=Ameca splendens TaxID=208324 RepID=A0ABV0YHT9_9TELE